MATFSDTLTYSNANLATQTNWENSTGAINIISNEAQGTTSLDMTRVTTGAISLTADQEVEVELITLSNFDNVGVCCRTDLSGNGYVAIYKPNNSKIYLYSSTAGSLSELTNIINALSTTDVLKLKAIGTTISIEVDTGTGFSEVISEINTDWSSGQSGISYQRQNNGSSRVDNFSTSDIGAASAVIDDINTDETIVDGEQDITFTTSNYSGEITTAKLVSGIDILSGTGVTSTSGAGTFDISDTSTYTEATSGSPFTSTNNAVVARLSDGTDTDDLAVTYNPKSGWSVVELASVVKTEGSIFENVVEAVANESQAYFPTAYTTSVSATGILSTDSELNFTIQWWDTTTGEWKQIDVLIEEMSVSGTDIVGTLIEGVGISGIPI